MPSESDVARMAVSGIGMEISAPGRGYARAPLVPIIFRSLRFKFELGTCHILYPAFYILYFRFDLGTCHILYFVFQN